MSLHMSIQGCTQLLPGMASIHRLAGLCLCDMHIDMCIDMCMGMGMGMHMGMCKDMCIGMRIGM